MGYKGWENFKAGAKKPVSAKRQYQGYRNRELGAGLEEYIKAACEVYRLYNLAEVATLFVVNDYVKDSGIGDVFYSVSDLGHAWLNK